MPLTRKQPLLSGQSHPKEHSDLPPLLPLPEPQTRIGSNQWKQRSPIGALVRPPLGPSALSKQGNVNLPTLSAPDCRGRGRQTARHESPALPRRGGRPPGLGGVINSGARTGRRSPDNPRPHPKSVGASALATCWSASRPDCEESAAWELRGTRTAGEFRRRWHYCVRYRVLSQLIWERPQISFTLRGTGSARSPMGGHAFSQLHNTDPWRARLVDQSRIPSGISSAVGGPQSLRSSAFAHRCDGAGGRDQGPNGVTRLLAFYHQNRVIGAFP